MAKAPKKNEKPKASKEKRAAKIKAVKTEAPGNAPENNEKAEPIKNEAPKKASNKAALTAKLAVQFGAVRDTLTSTNSGLKQPRQLRWALKTLAMAEEAAARAVQHSE